MAKRKRLDLPQGTEPPALETKSAFQPKMRMPIADVAGDVAGRAALEEVAREMTAAETEGRVVKRLHRNQIDTQHLTRDRLVFDEDEMAALKASIAERGQQTPIEVVLTSGGRYGLISGLRRMIALGELGIPEVLALVKTPETSQGTYQAMVEENEIRANLSFYERAQIVVAAARQGVYPDTSAAVKGLFAHAPKARRSKILGFVTLCAELGDQLRFPTHIPEHLGLALSKALKSDPGFAARLRSALSRAAPDTPEKERNTLEQSLKGPVTTPNTSREQIGPGLMLEAKAGRAVLTGAAVDEAFLQALRDWVAQG